MCVFDTASFMGPRKSRLRVGLDFRTRILGDVEQREWLRNGLFTGRGLHYGHDFFGGEHQTWTEKMTWLPTWQHDLSRGVSPEAKFLEQPQTLGPET